MFFKLTCKSNEEEHFVYLQCEKEESERVANVLVHNLQFNKNVEPQLMRVEEVAEASGSNIFEFIGAERVHSERAQARAKELFESQSVICGLVEKDESLRGCSLYKFKPL